MARNKPSGDRDAGRKSSTASEIGVHLSRGKELLDRGEFGAALEQFEQARKVAHEQRDMSSTLTALLKKSLSTYKDAERTSDRWREALGLLDEAMHIARGPELSPDERKFWVLEILGQRGACHKYAWEQNGRHADLLASFANYWEAYELSLADNFLFDQAYNAINAAFLLDRLARFEDRQLQAVGEASRPNAAVGTGGEAAEDRRHRASEIRAMIAERLPLTREKLLADLSQAEAAKSFLGKLRANFDGWWYYATLAESRLGLDDHVGAIEALRSGLSPGAGNGGGARGATLQEQQSTARQLAALGELLDSADELRLGGRTNGTAGDAVDRTSRPKSRRKSVPTSKREFDEVSRGRRRVVEEGLGLSSQAVQSLRIGKVGLALSGGGFRASLFHIGVLARLAEEDLLRHVHVISCVSGGSIIGAHYYLALQKTLVETKPDEAITRDDYIALVRRVAEDFLEGVQTDLRTQMTGSLPAVCKMWTDPARTFSDRLAELYQSRLFSRIAGVSDDPLPITRLLANPARSTTDSDAPFKPHTHNWRRAAKVPMLVLNATALNTGHNWQFTASFMGESPALVDREIDVNPRLRRMYYARSQGNETTPARASSSSSANDIVTAPAEYADFPVGKAVAASAGVPGAFPPIALPRLYEGMTVELVDGGLFDNQGIMGLLEQECTTLIISDASGQSDFKELPNPSSLGVAMRASELTMASVRTAHFQSIRRRMEAGQLTGALNLHLKRGLDHAAVKPVGAADSSAAPAAGADVPVTPYRVARDVQERLAQVRTDLDSFCDLEAFALMTSGYRMTEHYLAAELPHLKALSRPVDQRHDWPFLRLSGAMEDARGDDYDRLRHVLSFADKAAFRIWHLWFGFNLLGLLAGVGVAILVSFLLALAREGLPASVAVSCIAAAGAVVALGGLAVGLPNSRTGRLARRLGTLALATSTFPFAWLHLRIFNRQYLEFGALPEAKVDRRTGP